MAHQGIVEKLTVENQYTASFLSARTLATQIFTRIPPQAIQIITTEQCYYVDHGLEHSNRIISKLNNLSALLTEPLNILESYILAIAAYYHDISLFIGRTGQETPEQVRNQHHTKSAEIVQLLQDQHQITIGNNELEIIKRVITAHRVIDLTNLPENQRIQGHVVRTRLLGAFIRIADACDCDESRAPKVIFDLYYQQIPLNSRTYWEAHFPITDVTFERRRSAIVLSVDFSGGVQERVEKYRLCNQLKKKLESELKSVENVFQSYNIPVVRVEIMNFSNSIIVNLQSLPSFENSVTIVICSDSEKIEVLDEISTPLASNNNEALQLIIEFRQPEGPLFADTDLKIEKNQLDVFQERLESRLGEDFRGFESKTIEKTSLRRGTTQ